ncbi:hypothetical protein ACHHYP_09856 [Achlya hypogyna]|uniref:Ubiquitin-activating enzyme E1 n=1 Tax=Achlya hypogyna TaxID=1202772 RepID=A0A1V9ZIQ0_ACHHY|nr:hypothetical protein ACHHYP_09856 [Achlya hypogyna]
MAAAAAKEFYARQLMAYGPDWMKTITSMHVLVVGLRSVGVELVKNLVLQGVRVLTLHDDSVVLESDVATSTWYTASTTGQKRSTVVRDAAAKKSPHVAVRTLSGLVLFSSGLTREEIVGLNEFCRVQVPPIGTIVVESRGLLGSVFVDFGPAHEAWEEETLEFTVTSADISTGAVTVREDAIEQYLQPGDVVDFSFCQAPEAPALPWLHAQQLRVVEITAENACRVDLTPVRGVMRKLDLAQQPRLKLRRKSFRESILTPAVVESLYYGNAKDQERSLLLHCVLHGLHTFEQTHGCVPECNNPQHAAEVIKLIRAFVASSQAAKCTAPTIPLSESSLLELVRCAGAEFTPLSATIAGLAAHEVLKFSGRGCPLTQVWYTDVVHVLPPRAELQKETSFFDPLGSRDAHMRAIFGSAALARLQAARIVVVGCGAVGSELLKNLAVLGIGTGAVVDGETLRVLSAAALCLTAGAVDLATHAAFDAIHLGANKAASVAALFGGRFTALPAALDPTERNAAAGEAFWSAFDVVVCTAAHPVIAKYLDEQSFLFGKPLLIATADTWRGRVRAVVPEATERWIARNLSESPLHPLDQVAARRARLSSISVDDAYALRREVAFEAERLAVFARGVWEQYFGARLSDLATYCSERATYQPRRHDPAWLAAVHATLMRLLALGPAPACLDQAFHLLAEAFVDARTDFVVARPTHAALLHVTAVLLAKTQQLCRRRHCPRREGSWRLTLDTCAVAAWTPPSGPTAPPPGPLEAVSVPELGHVLSRLVIAPFDPWTDGNHHVLFVQRWCNAMAESHDLAPMDFATCKGLCAGTGSAVATASVVAGVATTELLKLVLRKPTAVREADYFPASTTLRFSVPPPPRQLASVALEVTRGVPLRVCPERMTLWCAAPVRAPHDPSQAQAGGASHPGPAGGDSARPCSVQYEVVVESIKWQQTTLFRSSDTDKSGQSMFALWAAATAQPLRESFLLLEVICKDADGDVVLPPVQLYRPKDGHS